MMVSKVISASLIASAALFSVESMAAEPAASSSAIEPKSAVASKKATTLKATTSWRKAMSTGHYQDAADALSKVIDSADTPHVKKAKALLNRALAHQHLRQYKQSVADYTKALDLKALTLKVRAIALYNRGLAHRKMGHPASSIEDFTSALFLTPRFPHAYYSRANVMRTIGRHELALEDYKNAMKFGYSKPHLPYYGMAVTYDAMKAPAKARQSLKEVLDIKPDFKPALRRYAELAGEPYHGAVPSQKVASAAKLPFKPGGSKIATEPHNPPSKSELPSAVSPPTAYLKASSSSAKTESDSITTASIGSAARAQGWRVNGAKHEFRYPGFAGATSPVPNFLPTTAQATDRQDENLTITPVAANPSAVPQTKAKIVEAPKAKKIKKTKVASLDPVVSPAEPKQEKQIATSPWRVQINSQRSETAAKSTWNKLKKRHSRALGDADVVFQRADLGKKGIYWRVQLAGFDTKADAHKKCKSLKRNRLRCLVLKAG